MSASAPSTAQAYHAACDDNGLKLASTGAFGRWNMTLGRRKDVSFGVKALITTLAYLVDYNDITKVVRVSQARLGEEMGTTARSVGRFVKEALKLDLLAVVRHPNGVNSYRLTCLIEQARQDRSGTPDRTRVVPAPDKSGSPDRTKVVGDSDLHSDSSQKKNLSESIGRDAGSVRPGVQNGDDRRARVFAQVLARGEFTAEQIEAGMAHPKLSAMTVKAVLWATRDLAWGKRGKKTTTASAEAQVAPPETAMALAEPVSQAQPDVLAEMMAQGLLAAEDVADALKVNATLSEPNSSAEVTTGVALRAASGLEADEGWRRMLVGVCGQRNSSEVLATWWQHVAEDRADAG